MSARGRPPVMPRDVPFYMWLFVELKRDRAKGPRQSARWAFARVAEMFQESHIVWSEHRVRKLYQEAQREIAADASTRRAWRMRLEVARARMRRQGWVGERAYLAYAIALELECLPTPLPSEAAAKIGRAGFQRIWGDWR